MRKQIKGILAAALSAAMVVSFGSAAGVNKASAEDTTTDTTTEAKQMLTRKNLMRERGAE